MDSAFLTFHCRLEGCVCVCVCVCVSEFLISNWCNWEHLMRVRRLHSEGWYVLSFTGLLCQALAVALSNRDIKVGGRDHSKAS